MLRRDRAGGLKTWASAVFDGRIRHRHPLREILRLARRHPATTARSARFSKNPISPSCCGAHLFVARTRLRALRGRGLVDDVGGLVRSLESLRPRRSCSGTAASRSLERLENRRSTRFDALDLKG